MVGFEMLRTTARKSKDPKRIVPLAMYVSVVGLGIFYVITSWAALSGYATTGEAAVQAQTNAAAFFLDRPSSSATSSCGTPSAT
jgi:amino acid transporter